MILKQLELVFDKGYYLYDIMFINLMIKLKKNREENKLFILYICMILILISLW